MASITPIDATLGRYELGERVAVGGMSEVYRALDLQTGETVAIKMLLPQHASNPDIRRGIEREAELQRMVSHPNLVRLRDVINNAHTQALVLEWVSGLTLAEVLEMAGDAGLGPEATRYIGKRLMDAIAAIHNAADSAGASLRIVHRDIKPGNIMLTADGEVKLADFGIARSVLESHTRTGTVKGSLAYLAPEQATESTIDARTDLYLAGLVLFETLTGNRYLQGEREIDLLRAAEDPPERRPSEHGAPSSWDRLFGKALARFPEERFRSAEAFKKALAAHGDNSEWPDLKLARLFDERPSLRAIPSPPPRPKPRWIVPATLLTGGVLVALGFGVHTARQAQTAEALGGTTQDASELEAPAAASRPPPGAQDENSSASASGPPDTTLGATQAGIDTTDAPLDGSTGLDAAARREARPGLDASSLAQGGTGPDAAARREARPGLNASSLARGSKRSDAAAPREGRGSPRADDTGRTAARSESDARPSEPSQTIDADAKEELAPSDTERRANAREGLRAALERLRDRGLTENDVPNPLRARLRRDSCSDVSTVSQCETDMARNVAALDGLTLSRELLEKKVARLQRALPRNADDDIKQKSNLALQALLDGRLAVANRYLNNLERAISGTSPGLSHN
ncbi:MAG: protein kinase [Myxococcota bacterium]